MKYAVLAVALAVVFHAFTGRYGVAVAEAGIFRIDQLTGDVVRCFNATDTRPVRLVCGVAPDYAKSEPVASATDADYVMGIGGPRRLSPREVKERAAALEEFDMATKKEEERIRAREQKAIKAASEK